MKRPLDKITNYQLELVKDKVCAAIADAVARALSLEKINFLENFEKSP